jgi:predicted phosphate transport protein (TIGR00153 family)
MEDRVALTRDKFFWDAFSSHAQQSVEAAAMLVEMLEHPDRREPLAARIKELEYKGDEITRETVQALHQIWITPLDREEIHGLISKLDDVLDIIELASDRIALYEIRDVRPEATELAKVLANSAGAMQKAVSMLTDLKNADPLMELCAKINLHEYEADQIYRSALARLFHEKTDALEIIKWRDIFDALETATDRAEDVSNIIQGIVMEHGR